MSTLTKAQRELLNAAKRLVHYLEMAAAGTIAGPVDPQARCVTATEDAIRLAKAQGIQSAQVADASGDPSDESMHIACNTVCMESGGVVV